MANFCPKCGKSNRAGISFCTSCGAKLRTNPIQREAVLAPPPPRGSGCGAGCLIGCLVVIVIAILVLGAVIGIIYYYVFAREVRPGSYFDVDDNQPKTVKCDTLSCLEENLEKCAPAKGEAEMGEFAVAEIEVLGTSGSSCVVYAEIKEIKELPPGLTGIPDFILDKMFTNLSLECLIPENVYKEGIEEMGDYIGENMAEVCEGPLFDLAEKFGVDLEDLNN